MGTSCAFGACPGVSNRAETCNIFFFNFDNLKSYKLYLSHTYLPDIRKQTDSRCSLRMLLSRSVNAMGYTSEALSKIPKWGGRIYTAFMTLPKDSIYFLEAVFFFLSKFYLIFLRNYAIGVGNSSLSPFICSSSQGSQSPSISAL